MDVEEEAKEDGEEEEKEQQHRDTNLCITSWRSRHSKSVKISTSALFDQKN